MKKRRKHVVIAIIVSCVVGMMTWVGSGHARIPILLAPFFALNRTMNPELVASVGEVLGENSHANAHAVSGQFGVPELRKLVDLVNSEAFQRPLTNYNCGDPVPKLKFRATLYRASRAYAGARRVELRHEPALNFAATERCLDSGLSFLVNQAFAQIDPSPGGASSYRTTREPRCDCSKRDENGEWVTFPGPDINLW
jgi:hypothetical protein